MPTKPIAIKPHIELYDIMIKSKAKIILNRTTPMQKFNETGLWIKNFLNYPKWSGFL